MSLVHPSTKLPTSLYQALFTRACQGARSSFLNFLFYNLFFFNVIQPRGGAVAEEKGRGDRGPNYLPRALTI